MQPMLLMATFAAGFLYVISPGPAFLALFSLAATRGRGAGLRFLSGHLVGDTVWGTLALAAIIGVSEIGGRVFDLLGIACGIFLVYLGLRAIFRPGGEAQGAEPVGARRPLLTGVIFGLTNPKAYPVSLSMFTALTAGFSDQLSWSDAPALMASAFAGFVAADAVLVFWAGLPVVRRFFLRHSRIITRAVGVLFVLFGARAGHDAMQGLLRRA